MFTQNGPTGELAVRRSVNTEYCDVRDPGLRSEWMTSRVETGSAPWRRYGRYMLWLALAVAAILCRNYGHPAAEVAGQADGPAKKRVRVITRCEGGMTHFFVENFELAEVTVSFHFDLTNMKGTVDFPYTASFPPQQTTAAFSLAPMEADAPSHYRFTNYHILGSNAAVHDDSVRYSLPYAPGRAFRVTQGYDGKFSHQGSSRYAIDWRMPVGTPVHAARGGRVVRRKDHSALGGPNLRFDGHNNYVLIRHDDGTLGHYCHLLKGSVKVDEGDLVTEGDLIALSGNTGFSSGPHLHFCVYKASNGKERESIPVKFKTSAGNAITLKAGQRYTARAATHADSRHLRRPSTSTRSAGS